MRMSAARALGKWDRVDARPAPTAHNAVIADAHGSVAHDADFRQQQIGESDRRGADGVSHIRWNDALHESADPHRHLATDARMAARSGATPNQSSNARAPWPNNIGSPLAARSPRECAA